MFVTVKCRFKDVCDYFYLNFLGFRRQFISYKKMNSEYVGEWKNIPENAFLYFPTGQEVIVGSEEKQWRKIFEGGQTYNTFETNALEKLDKKVLEERIVLDLWFDVPNRLRFLQANKFKISKTVDSMTETSKWRSTSYPVTLDSETQKLLNSGAIYFCGRDDKYRPILVVDIGRFDPDAEDNDSIQKALVIIMEFMINQLLIKGQVENYVLIMNLEEATFGLRGIIMKILSFTSNAYRGRLFASYILSMPTVIRWGWDAIISKFVSQNTLKKLKITGEGTHDDMWTHISKKTVERQYNGSLANQTAPFWPPKHEHLIFTDPDREANNHLISVEEYNMLFRENRLIDRKILSKFVLAGAQGPPSSRSYSAKAMSGVDHGAVIPIRDYGKMSEWSHRIFEMEIKKETYFQIDKRTIFTFFQSHSFKRIGKVTSQ